VGLDGQEEWGCDVTNRPAGPRDGGPAGDLRRWHSGIGGRRSIVELGRGVVEDVADAVPQHEEDGNEPHCDERDDEGVFHKTLTGLVTRKILPQRLHAASLAFGPARGLAHHATREGPQGIAGSQRLGWNRWWELKVARGKSRAPGLTRPSEDQVNSGHVLGGYMCSADVAAAPHGGVLMSCR
jgi:hypothetical protein